MKVSFKRLIVALTLIFIGVSCAYAGNKLPLADGVYLTKDDCDLYNSKELDMARLTVEKNGREFSFEEGYCLPAKVSEIRQNRYHVTADCDEYGDISQQSFFLDVKPDSKISLDGEDLELCLPKPVSSNKINSKAISEKQAKPLIDNWLKQIRDCEQPGDAACERLSKAISMLENNGWCYGKETDAARSDYVWHLCDVSSIRQAQNYR